MELSIKARLLGVCAQVMLDGSMPPIALPVVRGLYLAASRDLPPLDTDIKARAFCSSLVLRWSQWQQPTQVAVVTNNSTTNYTDASAAARAAGSRTGRPVPQPRRGPG